MVVVFSENIDKFQTDPIEAFGGRTVDVTGTIESYAGHPQIIVTLPSQISVASG